MLRCGFEVYTGCYTRMGHYNRELSAIGEVLGRYIQGGVTFKGALLFSVYGIAI